MCLLKCAGARSGCIPALGLFVARLTFISTSHLCKSYSGASRLSSVFSALLSVPFSRFSFYLLSLLIHLSRRFFDDSLEPRNPRSCNEIYCSRSIIYAEIVLGAEYRAESNYEQVNFSHRDSNLDRYADADFQRCNRLPLQMLKAH